jgi:outer membrane protein OmpA-like peptidoglycan-associated protein
VPGDDIIFDDNLEKETLGEFPSQWDLYAGSAEVASANGKKAIEMANADDAIGPLMKNAKNYLGDVFTIEFDLFFVKGDAPEAMAYPILHFFKPDSKTEIMSFGNVVGYNVGLSYTTLEYVWTSSSGTNRGNVKMNLAFGTWHHVAVSFNKRAWKVYINGERVVNVPNVSTPPGWVELQLEELAGSHHPSFMTTNWRIAKGAVPLYDRLQSEGKIVTYGITFDVGKSTIKPESMTEINRIAQLMKDNPDVKFSVEGHTDNTGTAASNHTLSEARSKAVVDNLVE